MQGCRSSEQRQPYRSESQHVPGHRVTSAMLRTTIKETPLIVVMAEFRKVPVFRWKDVGAKLLESTSSRSPVVR
jgi:hypothetical protein